MSSARALAGRYGLRVAALGYLAALLLIPVGLIFYRALEHGFSPAWDSISNGEARHAFWLTIQIALIAVPLNTIFGVLMAIAIVREVVPILREIGMEQEQAAATLGASGLQIFRRITLPAIRWGVAYGVVLTMARSLGEFGAVSVVSGHLQGRTETATLIVERYYEDFNYTGAYSVSIVLALLAIVTLVALTVLRPRHAD